MRIYKTKLLARFADKERIADDSLSEAIDRAARGLVDADLGGGIIKQRIARPGRGRSGGYRMLVAYREGNRAVFLYGFAKNERENISQDELQTLREIGANWLQASEKQITDAIEERILQEVPHGEESRTKPADKGSS